MSTELERMRKGIEDAVSQDLGDNGILHPLDKVALAVGPQIVADFERLVREDAMRILAEAVKKVSPESRVVPAAPAPAAPLEVLTPEMVAENNAVITRFEAEVARLTSELEQAQNSREDYKRKFHALAVQLDQSQKLCRIAEACRKDAEAELEQVKAALRKAKTFAYYARYELEDGKAELGDQFPKKDDATAIIKLAEAALGEKGKQ